HAQRRHHVAVPRQRGGRRDRAQSFVCRAGGLPPGAVLQLRLRRAVAPARLGRHERRIASAHEPRRIPRLGAVVILEILSESTARIDDVDKNAEYRASRSVQRYVMLEQDRQAATVFACEGDRWVGTLLTGDAVLAMPEIGIDLPLAELYEGLDLSQAANEAN